MPEKKSVLNGPSVFDRPASAGANLGSSALGAVVCAAILIFLLVLGEGLGLLDFGSPGDVTLSTLFRREGWPYAALCIVLSALAGGFVSGVLSRSRSKGESLCHGIGSWSLFLMGAFLFLSSILSSVSGVVAGTSASESAQVGVGKITEQLKSVRIVTDMKLLKGKAVTQLDIPREKESGAKSELKQAAGEAKQTASKSVWLLLAAMSVGAAGSAIGAAQGFRSSARASLQS